MQLKYSFLIILAFIAFQSKAQHQVNKNSESESFPYIYAAGGLNIPGGDLAKRFGINYSIGAGFGYKFASNWVLDIEGTYHLGYNVKEDPLMDLYNSDGNITTIYGEIALVTQELGGWFVKGDVGKIIPILGSNANSGLLLKAGAGIMSHKIRITHRGDNVPMIMGDYLKGYDRLCYGLAFSQFVGWSQVSQKNAMHFYAGIEVSEALTENRRSWDFATNSRLSGTRNDFQYSLKVGWYIPLKSRKASGYYYY